MTGRLAIPRLGQLRHDEQDSVLPNLNVGGPRSQCFLELSVDVEQMLPETVSPVLCVLEAQSVLNLGGQVGEVEWVGEVIVRPVQRRLGKCI